MQLKEYETLKLELRDNGILVVSLNRPDKYNAMSRQMVWDLIDLWTSLQHNLDIRVVILRGEGEKGFCGGYGHWGLFPAAYDEWPRSV